MAGQEIILTTILSLLANSSLDTQVGFPLTDNKQSIESLKSQKFTIVTSQNPPLSNVKWVNGKYVGDGAAFKFINLLQDKYGFQYDVILPDEDVMGDNQTGIFGTLFKKKADIAAVFLPVINEGQSVVQYSRNLDAGDWVVLMKRPKESAKGSGLLAPFTVDVWLLILVSLIAVGPTIYLLIILRAWMCPTDEKNKKFPLPSCVWFVYGALLKQGSTLSPVSDSTRLIFATWWIFITILTAFYTANLTAFLTLSEFTLPIKKPTDVLQYNWVARKGSAIEHAAYDENEQDTTTDKAEFVLMNNSDILDKYVTPHNFLYLQEQPIVNYVMYSDYVQKRARGIPEEDRCTFVVTDWPVITRARAFAYRLDFEWAEQFDKTFQYLVEAGIVKFQLNEGVPNTKICPLNLKTSERQLRNTDLWTTYEVIFVGFGISGFIFICEVFIRYRKLCCNGKLKLGNIKDDGDNNNYYNEKEKGIKGNYFTPPPPSYQTLFGHHKNAQKKIVNGRDYWVIKSPDGETRLIPVRTPSALLFQYTN